MHDDNGEPFQRADGTTVSVPALGSTKHTGFSRINIIWLTSEPIYIGPESRPRRLGELAGL
ncbi:hypothetical protein, partial [Mycetohabitans sp. B4]|uniref:hypothetical protein n=1 Tax=Mycetohabitans sp. B4 TaxID=2841842 RepID=UPI001F206B93